MNLGLCHTGNRIRKISLTLSKVLGDCGGGRGGGERESLHLRFLFCKIVHHD